MAYAGRTASVDADMLRSRLRAIAFAVALAPTLALAEGAPDLAFGDEGFVTYEHSQVEGEPQIERGLHLGRLPNGDLVTLAQHRFQDADAVNHALIVVFAPGGAVRGASLPTFAFPAPPDPPIAAVSLDPDGNALLIGESGGSTQLHALAVAVVGGGPGYSPTLQANIPVDTGQGDRQRAVVAFSDGSFIACGMRQFPAGAAQTLLPICRKFSALGTIDTSFGNASPFASAGSLFLTDADIAGLQSGRILAAALDRAGRIIVAGSIRLDGVAEELAFSARLDEHGSFDASYCAGATCGDAIATAPGWRADAVPDARDYDEAALVERGDGVIVRAYDVRRELDASPQIAITLHARDGALLHAQPLQVGTWTRVGGQLGVQSDDKVLLPLTFRPDASSQFGALARLTAQPAIDGLLDASFEAAPPGVAPVAGLSIVRPLLAGGLPAASVECNAVLVDTDRLTCAGLVRSGSTPVNLDLLLARVTVAAPLPVFDDGFE
jgi:hypothetical protein